MSDNSRKEILSKEGEEFILNLNLYLMSTGKSEAEIKEFIEEAEEHLILGEKEGKTVKDIFGNSPQEYAQSVANELDFNKREVISDILMLILGFGTWILFSKINEGQISFSYLECIATPLIYFITIAGLLIINKKLIFKEKKHTIASFILFLCNITGLVIIEMISNNMNDVLIMNRTTVNIAIILLFIVNIVISYKIKTYMLMLPFIFYIFTIIYNFTNIKILSNSILEIIIPLILCIIFVKIEMKRIENDL